jgi:ribosome biogenesis GTPase
MGRENEPPSNISTLKESIKMSVMSKILQPTHLTKPTRLIKIGWDDGFAAIFETYRLQGLVPGRVVKQHRESCLVAGESGEMRAGVSGRFRHATADRTGFPAIGDWTAVEPAGPGKGVIQAVLPRRSAFLRKAAGESTEAQVLAANIDTVFLVAGLDGDFNLSRLERYLTAAWDSGASPVIVLNKADLRPDLEAAKAEVDRIALGAPVVAVGAKDGLNLEALGPFLTPGKTIALLGSSGAGKSTLINRLLGEERLATKPVREDDSRGRHTTTHRELVALAEGALLIDTPGLRELGLWAEDESLERAFDDIAELAPGCRFADCRHEAEPGCAVRAAVETGALDARRLENFLKQRRELRFLALKQDEKALRRSEKAVGRRMASLLKDIKRYKPNYR